MVAEARHSTKKTRVRISKSGQVTLPSEIRKSLGVEVGEYVTIREDANGRVTIEPFAPLTIEEFAGSVGAPPDGKTLTDYLGEVDRTPMVRSIYEQESKYDDPD